MADKVAPFPSFVETLSVQSHTLLERQFQLLINQSLLGLPIEKLLANYPQFQSWFEQIQKECPEIWTVPDHNRATNYPVTQSINGQQLRTIYDVLIANDEMAEIYRWKASEPLSAQELIQDWYVGLDLFRLVENRQYHPEKVSLTYWFLTQFKAVKVTVKYSKQLHQQFKERLSFLEEEKQQLLRTASNSDEALEDLTTRFLRGEMSAIDYLNALPEVEI